MAIRRLVAQDDSQETQRLKIDAQNRFIENHSSEWQFLFGPNSELINSRQILKIAAELDTSTLANIRIIGYLYNEITGNIDAAASVIFNVYRVEDITTPRWNDQPILILNGILQSNNYFFVESPISSFTGANLDGDTTLMIEAVALRSGTTYRNRIYVNHLGIYENVFRLRQDVEFLKITKEDI